MLKKNILKLKNIQKTSIKKKSIQKSSIQKSSIQKSSIQKSSLNIYIISNFYNIDTNIFNSIKSEDLVVFMNSAFHDNSFFDNNKKLLFIRGSKGCKYLGYKENYNNRYDTIFFINFYINNSKYGGINNIQYKNNIDTCKKIIIEKEINSFSRDYNYTKNKSPTSGFIAYMYIKKRYPNSNIFLVGFTGTSSRPNSKPAVCHDYVFEQKYYDTHKIKLLNKTKT